MWNQIIEEEGKKDYFHQMLSRIEESRKVGNVFPDMSEMFRAFSLTPPEEVKVIIIGQDPYYLKGQADGLAFSTKSLKRPRSLDNIFKELWTDLNIQRTANDLSGWARQGVLLINTSLSVEENKPNSHQNIGWEKFMNCVFKELEKKSNLVYILWGKNSQKYEGYINDHSFKIISSHPSPLAARISFFGSHPFSKTNEYLKKTGQKEIDWSK